MQSISVYSILLILYGIIMWFLQDKRLTFFSEDPVFILLLIFILGSFSVYLWKRLLSRKLVVGEDFIAFKNRFTENKFNISEIENIFLGRERPFQGRESYRVIKLKLKDKKRKIRIRPHNYWDDLQLYETIKKLSDKI